MLWFVSLFDILDSKHRLERAHTQAHSCTVVRITNQTNSLTCHESYWNMATKCSNDNSKQHTCKQISTHKYI